MLGKENSSNDPTSDTRLHGSAVLGYNDPLDRERAASMADEGGASGAHIDALEHHRAQLTRESRKSRMTRMTRMTMAPVVGMIVLGAAAGLCMLLLSRARQPRSKLAMRNAMRWLNRAFAR